MIRGGAWRARLAPLYHPAVNDIDRHRWIAVNLLPLEPEARNWLARHCRSLSRHEIDDLVQEAYSRIWSADFSRVNQPRAYFFRTLRNLLAEGARHAQIVPMERMAEIGDLFIPNEEPGPERRISARQELERLHRLLDRLPIQCRRVFELRRIQGHSQQETAAIMGLSESTVEKHLAKAIECVAEEIESEARLNEGASTSKGGHHGRRNQPD